MLDDDLWAAALDWQAYLEEVTAGIRPADEARAVREELRGHLEQARQALLAQGLSPAAAAREALAGMGGAGAVGSAFAGPTPDPPPSRRAPGLARIAAAVLRYRTGLVAIAACVVIAGLGSALGAAHQRLAAEAVSLQQLRDWANGILSTTAATDALRASATASAASAGVAGSAGSTGPSAHGATAGSGQVLMVQVDGDRYEIQVR